MAGLRFPSPMLHPGCCHPRRTGRGQGQWLAVPCKTLSFSIPSRFSPALSLTPSRTGDACCPGGQPARGRRSPPPADLRRDPRTVEPEEPTRPWSADQVAVAEAFAVSLQDEPQRTQMVAEGEIPRTVKDLGPLTRPSAGRGSISGGCHLLRSHFRGPPGGTWPRRPRRPPPTPRRPRRPLALER